MTAKTGTGNDTLTISAEKMTGRLGDKQGALLEGTAANPAKISHPQLEVSAPRIKVASDENYPIKNVVATGGVQFKVSLAQNNAPRVRIEARCDNATLDRGEKMRVLTLSGGVDGWFQSGDGPRNQLRGQTVKITSQPESANALVADIKGDAQGVRVDVPPPGKAALGSKPITITAQNAQLRQTQNGLDADVDGGTLGVRLEIPAVAKNAAPGALNNGLNLGAVVVTSQRASVRQADGQARFTGNARAASSGEDTVKFDVSADELSISRATNGEIAAIKTTGRAKMKLELPPDVKDKPAGETANKIRLGKPNYVEVEANSATADLPKNSLIFEGDVRGFYRLPVADQQDATPKDYQFSGERAVISYAPEAGDLARGLNFDMVGSGPQKQAEFELPFRLEGF